MRRKSILLQVMLLISALTSFAQSGTDPKPVELDVLKAAVGVWDATIKVWPQGMDNPPITFLGVETNVASGEYWIASKFDSEAMGQKMTVHSIVGYDLDLKQLVGTVIDHGPYAASMTGKYDTEKESVQWETLAKTPDGQVLVQNSVVTQPNPDKRVLVLSVPAPGTDEITKFMEITYIKRP